VRCFDVFNGDADGICALRQLRLAEPREAVLVTGLKRDIELVKRVRARAGDAVTVLDVSLERNREALDGLLAAGVSVRYFDHHAAGEVPRDVRLEAHLDESPMTCTSALVDRFVDGRFRAWAVAGAFGDNLPELAAELGASAGLDADALEWLRELGESINYNAYGETLDDVLVAPGELYRMASLYADPLPFARDEPLVARLTERRVTDLHRALARTPHRSTSAADVYVLPDAAWSRRVCGTFANRLALSHPDVAHAVVTPRSDGGYAVSVRAPRATAASALDFCRAFPGGGGRSLAGGIERLAPDRLESFIDAFALAWPR
jgi:hypothetical protein